MSNKQASKKAAKGRHVAPKKGEPALRNLTPKKGELPVWAAAFIAALRENGNISAACRDAGVSRPVVYELRMKSEDFAALWKDALDDACDALELEARRRAKDGVTKTVFYKGEPIGTEHEYSDTLMIFLLKAHRPEVYRETVRNEHGGKDGGPIELVVRYETKK